MCGIMGVVRLDGATAAPELVRAGTSTLDHRGPDEVGYWAKGPAALGHTRLSIIDVEGSHQPMSDASNHVHLCFNGEIFNYKQLRQELETQGYRFCTGGDTEVILALYLMRGPDQLDALEGQFAFAIFDEREGVLWLYRDRLGILPLHYYRDPNVFVFASEVKALLPALPQLPNVDEESLKEHLAYRTVPGPHTLFENVFKLLPGHRLRIELSGRMHVDAWWQLPTEPALSDLDPVEATALVDETLTRAVKSRLLADVPVGAFLSGGVDSSLIVALMTKIKGGEQVKTYSAGFEDPRFDELPYAQQVSDQLGTDHHPVVVSARDFQHLWHRLTWHRDAPISLPADVAVYLLAREARGTVKVLLSGEGSDELFAGYPKYRFARWAAAADWLPRQWRSALFHGLERIVPASMNRPRIMFRAMEASDEAERLEAWFAPFIRRERDELIAGGKRSGGRQIWEKSQGDLIRRMLYFDCHTWLVDNLLERGDRMSMAASIECRPPFLDHRLVELAFSIPSNLKVRGGVGKSIIKEIARKHLPASIVDRRKVGFRVPLDAWFRGELREMAWDLLGSPNAFVNERMDRKIVQSLLEDHARGRRNNEARIWTLLGLEVWHQVFYKNVRLPDAGSDR